ncbi:MAG: hypothetical protein MUC49_08470 [Raineya sp.]|jgi:hypothetical protein|nr:hypothetical protein [Raineya sp.]
MKKIILLSIAIFLYSYNMQAQKISLAKYAKERVESGNGMSPVVYKAMPITVDEANGYVMQYVVTTYDDAGNNIHEKTEYYQQYGLWKTNSGKSIIGVFESRIGQYGDIINDLGGLNLDFLDLKQENFIKIYNEEAVKQAYQNALANIQAKGAEGTECFYAELPRKGTTIKLYVVLNSELKKNKGVPTWKMQFGELVFDKNTGTFTFIKK